MYNGCYKHKRIDKEESQAEGNDFYQSVFRVHYCVFFAFVSTYCCQKIQVKPTVTITIDTIIIVFMYL